MEEIIESHVHSLLPILIIPCRRMDWQTYTQTVSSRAMFNLQKGRDGAMGRSESGAKDTRSPDAPRC